MIKKMLGTFTAMVAALAVVGVAWASTDDSTSTSVTMANSTNSSIDDSPSTSVTTDISTPTTVDDDRSSTSTSAGSSTSTSSGASTSSSRDDHGGDDDRSTTSSTFGSTTSTSLDDNDDRTVVAEGRSTHRIPGVGTVTIEVSGSMLTLVDVSAPGWNVETDKLESDRIELEFRAGEAEAEFEARIHDGRVEVEIDID
jgi:hypothetical protein